MNKNKILLVLFLVMVSMVNVFSDTKFDEKNTQTSNKNKEYVFNIDGTEKISKASTKLLLTKYQKAQINSLEMERRSKISSIDNGIFARKQMLDEELSKESYDDFVIDKISKEIKTLVVDKETINLNVDKKLRYVLGPDKYLIYKQKQDK